jgi:hypothetical protein
MWPKTRPNPFSVKLISQLFFRGNKQTKYLGFFCSFKKVPEMKQITQWVKIRPIWSPCLQAKPTIDYGSLSRGVCPIMHDSGGCNSVIATFTWDSHLSTSAAAKTVFGGWR